LLPAHIAARRAGLHSALRLPGRIDEAEQMFERLLGLQE
jgi:hypothetical protein